MPKITFDTTRLKEQVEDNPLLAAAIGAGLLTAVSKLMDSNTKRKNASSWNREVKRRERKS